MKTRHRHKRTRNKSKKRGGGFFGSVRNKLFGKKSPISKMPNQRMSESGNISYSPESLKHAYNFAVSSQSPKNLGRGSFGHVKKTLTNGVIKRTPFTEHLRRENGVLYATDPEDFREEVKLMKQASSLNNPYVVQLKDSYSNDNAGYVQLETLDSGSELQDAIEKNPKTVNLSNIKDIIIELLKGLDSIHERNILHLDIKPANIWVFPDTKKIKYFDFGLASIVGDNKNKYYSLQSGFRGSPGYSKEKKVLGSEENTNRRFTYDKTDDFYALSITIDDILISIIPEIIQHSNNPKKYEGSIPLDSLIMALVNDISINTQDKDILSFIVMVIKNLQTLENNEEAIDAMNPPEIKPINNTIVWN